MRQENNGSALWTPEQEDQIERAALAALDCIRDLGPMPAVAISRQLVLRNVDLDRTIANARGRSTPAEIAPFRLLSQRRVRFVSARVISITPEGSGSEGSDHPQQQILSLLRSHGGILTTDNLLRMLHPHGYDATATETALSALRKDQRIRRPFPTSPRRRVLDFPAMKKQPRVPDHVPEHLGALH